MREMLLELRDRTIREAINVVNLSSILTTLAALWSRISSAIGRGQAETAREQQSEIDAMDAEIQSKGANDVK